MNIYNFNYPVLINDYVLNIEKKDLSEKIIRKKCSEFLSEVRKQLQIPDFKLTNIQHKVLTKINNEDTQYLGRDHFCFIICLNGNEKEILNIKSPSYPYMTKDNLNITLKKGRCILFHGCLPCKFNIEKKVDIIEVVFEKI